MADPKPGGWRVECRKCGWSARLYGPYTTALVERAKELLAEHIRWLHSPTTTQKCMCDGGGSIIHDRGPRCTSGGPS